MSSIKEQSAVLLECAQEIALSTSQLLGHPMVITDTRGIIIGASDIKRLGCHHEASDEVVATGQPSQTTAEEAKKYKGTLPGVTYPLNSSSGGVVGTIAMTGTPEAVAPFARIVKKQVEILLREQELLVYSVTRENSLRNLIEDLAISDGKSKNTALIERAAAFGFDESWTYLPMEIDLYQFARVVSETQQKMGENTVALETEIHRVKQTVLLEIRRLFNNRRTLSSAMPGGRYALLYALTPATAPEEIAVQKRAALLQAQALCTRLGAMSIKIAIGVGRPHLGLQELVGGVAEARRALGLGKKFHRRPGVYDIDEFRIEELLPAVPRDVRSRFAATRLAPLRRQKDFDELAATIIAWCENSFSLVKAAEGLKAHRNTLIYRLDKLKDALGADPREFRVALELYLALLIDRYDSPTQKEP